MGTREHERTGAHLGQSEGAAGHSVHGKDSGAGDIEGGTAASENQVFRQDLRVAAGELEGSCEAHRESGAQTVEGSHGKDTARDAGGTAVGVGPAQDEKTGA